MQFLHALLRVLQASPLKALLKSPVSKSSSSMMSPPSFTILKGFSSYFFPFFPKMVHLGFSQATISWYRSYLTNRTFLINVEKNLSSPGDLTCGVPQGSILGPLIFLLYVNDMSNSVECDLFLYADDSCLVFTGPDLKSIETNLNKNFNSLFDWFVENKFSIHFCEDKTKSIVFGSQKRLKNLDQLDIRRGDIKIKQHTSVTY